MDTIGLTVKGLKRIVRVKSILALETSCIWIKKKCGILSEIETSCCRTLHKSAIEEKVQSMAKEPTDFVQHVSLSTKTIFTG